jgi:hypothetical protein
MFLCSPPHGRKNSAKFNVPPLKEIVHKSTGDAFGYNEMQASDTLLKALSNMLFGLVSSWVAVFPVGRYLLSKILPKSGEGETPPRLDFRNLTNLKDGKCVTPPLAFLSTRIPLFRLSVVPLPCNAFLFHSRVLLTCHASLPFMCFHPISPVRSACPRTHTQSFHYVACSLRPYSFVHGHQLISNYRLDRLTVSSVGS